MQTRALYNRMNWCSCQPVTTKKM